MSESRTRPKATVDTSLFVGGTIAKAGRPHRLLRRWLDEDVLELLPSKEQEAELTRVFRRPRIVRRSRLAPPLGPSLPVTVRDRNDEHVPAAALGGNADYLVTVAELLPTSHINERSRDGRWGTSWDAG